MYHVVTERASYQHYTATWPQRKDDRFSDSQKCRWFPEIHQRPRQGTCLSSTSLSHWWRWAVKLFQAAERSKPQNLRCKSRWFTFIHRVIYRHRCKLKITVTRTLLMACHNFAWDWGMGSGLQHVGYWFTSLIITFVSVCLSFVLSVCLSATSELNISETRSDSAMVPMDGLY